MGKEFKYHVVEKCQNDQHWVVWRNNRKLPNICFLAVHCDLCSIYSNYKSVELVNFDHIPVSISVSLLFSECGRGRAVKEQDCHE